MLSTENIVRHDSGRQCASLSWHSILNSSARDRLSRLRNVR